MKRRLFYPIKEIFLTFQGEGSHAGSRAVFVRVTGCNVWTGREEDRARDVAKGTCAAWCDTDFRGTDGENGGKWAANEIAAIARKLWARDGEMLIVVTGGEPSLVVDDHLVAMLHVHGARVHVETNGSNLLPTAVDWITLSPKPPMRVVEQRYDEVKVVYPADVNPHAYEECAPRRYLQPLDAKDAATNTSNLQRALDFIHANPSWRLSMQMHKIIGVP